MKRQVYEGFSVVLPDGWSDLEDDMTFAEPDEYPPIRFRATDGGPGVLLVTVPLFDRDEQPSADPGELAALARDWGARRGLEAPLASATRKEASGTLATAVYALRGQLVQVWFLSNGAGLIHASYVCAWEARDAERASREALVTSLHFA